MWAQGPHTYAIHMIKIPLGRCRDICHTLKYRSIRDISIPLALTNEATGNVLDLLNPGGRAHKRGGGLIYIKHDYISATVLNGTDAFVEVMLLSCFLIFSEADPPPTISCDLA